MYAVVKISGFQFMVKEGEHIKVPKLDAKVGETFDIGTILFVKKDDTLLIGNPTVKKAFVKARIIAHEKGNKILVYKYKKRKRYRRKKGHRQEFTDLLIEKIGVK